MNGDDIELESRLRPSAVVCADVERYSSLMDQHESLLKFDRWMGRLGHAIRKDLRESLGEDSAHRYVVKPVGDGVLLVYPGDIKKALEHAWTIHNHFNTKAGRARQREQGLWPFQARIAVHYGDVELIGNSPFNGVADAFGKTIVTCSRLEPATVPGMVWATHAAKDAAKAQGLSGLYKFQQIGQVDLAKNAGKELAYNLVQVGSQDPEFGAIAVKRYPKGIHADVHVLIRKPAGRLPNIHLAWGASHCMIHRSELRPEAGAYRIKHKLIGGPTDLPLLLVHTDPPCDVEFPELRFAADGKASLKYVDSGAVADVQELDTDADRWYILPNRT